MKPVRIFTVCFNPRYIDYLERFLVPSLLWPDNRAALDGAQFDIWTTEAERARIEPIVKRVGLPVTWNYGMYYRNAKDHSLARALIAELSACVSAGAAFLFASPDIVFGDGTIRAMREIARVPGWSPSFLPLRVRESFIEEMGAPLGNAQLVAAGMRHAHRSFLEADAERSQTNTERSGVSWRSIGKGLYAVNSSIQSAYLLQPTPGDVRWFGDRPKFGNYDHAFGGVLLEQGRARVIGSSDAAFVAEVTPDEVGMAKLSPRDTAEPDRYFQKLPHYLVNRNTVCVWRAA